VTFNETIGSATTVACANAALSGNTATCSFTPFAGSTGGTVSITATYNGSGTDSPSPVSAALSVVVLGANPLSTFTLSTSANPVASGKLVALSATLAGGSGTPTGTVTFSDTASPITCSGSSTPGAKLNASGVASCSYAPSGSGSHTITASYSGDVNYAPATNPTNLIQLVDGTTVPTSVVLTTSGSPNANNTSVTFTATVTGSTTTPGGTMAFTATVNSVTTTICASAPVNGSGTVSTASCAYDPTLSGTTGQSASIGATYSGDATYTAKTASAITQVEDGTNPTATFTLATSANPVASAKAITLTATLTGGSGTPTGTVVFADNGSPIACNAGSPAKLSAGAIATCAYTPAGSGFHTLSASYSGDMNYAPATNQTNVSELVDGTTAPTSVVLTSSADPNAFNTAVTFTATVSGSSTVPGNWVTFTATVASVTTTLCANQAVSGATNSTTVTASCNYNPTLAGPSGQSATINATYSGDATYASKAATALTQVEDGNAALSTFTLLSGTNPSVSGKLVTFTVTLAGGSGTPTGTVTFSDGGTPVICSGASSPGQKVNASGVATCSYAPTGNGTHVISALYSGDINYASAPDPTNVNQVVG
jgi:VCBS repeat-containing protein